MSEQSSFLIACAQLNTIVGDFEGNARKILEAARQAVNIGARLLVCPEMSVTGYPAQDWLLREDFCKTAQAWVESLGMRLAAQAPGLAVVFGSVLMGRNGRKNALYVFKDGELLGVGSKQHLQQSIFDETRVFKPGHHSLVLKLGKRLKVGFAVGDDVCCEDCLAALKQAGANLVVSIHADAWTKDGCRRRELAVASSALRVGMPLVCVNMYGGQDEFVFDGHSFACSAAGEVVMRMPSESTVGGAIDAYALAAGKLSSVRQAQYSGEAELYDMLVMAVRDYVYKNGFKSVVLGLSGGVDSALVAAIAADAVGPENVLAVMMPTRFTADLSQELAQKCAQNLGVDYVMRPIEPLFAAFMDLLKDDFAGRKWSEAEENLQARIRGTLLMAYSNKFSRLVLTTGNKSESAVGYSTLYGDTAGAFAPLKDVLKTEVWALCREVNARAGFERIPQAIIDRAPSAELREGQVDEQSLPRYSILDQIIAAYVEKGRSVDEIVKSGFERAVVGRVVRLIHRSEYKRRQCPVGPKISRAAFGSDWRFPMTAKLGTTQEKR